LTRRVVAAVALACLPLLAGCLDGGDDIFHCRILTEANP
jgi:hypothetical protein